MTTTIERPATTAGSDFAVLARRIGRAGLLDRKPGYYAVRLSVVGLMLIGGWTAFFLVGASWWTLAVAAFLAVTFAQVALVAHDLAHRQVFRTAGPSARAGRIAGNLAVGMSYGYWMDKHTRHHANPNHDDLDPDVAPAVLVWSAEAAAARRGRFDRWLTRHQAWLFFPLLTLLGLSLRKDSIKALRTGTVKHRALEGALMGAHVAGYLCALVLVLSPLQALAFVAVHQALFGVYLGMTFAPNHKGMPHPTGDEDFLRKQVLTSRNVRGGRLTDMALGGLNYQIEHHLFPAMPTPNLRRAQPIVQAYCAEIGVPYEMTSLARSYGIALRHLHEVGAPLRP
ncbi:fatty acid desaturase family protein [Couchioplanes caeruleus]|uniref:Delta fatty acid desaturase n=2 Tax=Couchioplanes caeruleus TaxID=56438 RepID=A0A1K0FDG1_9ACTN|nr:acyl-CoA desaturase [Couchioplanes caeruleus]OJF10877.1 delta fatty acid desaturase [Couchioplanes caeruleus subsp. caeruleus]ROP32784.1 fatty acid desaturase [Couchioplanes caeruleus]